MEAALKYIVAVVIIAHGIGHVMGFLAAWTDVPMGFTDSPWVLSQDVSVQGPVGRAFGLLWLVALIGFAGAGLGLLAGQDWWRWLAVAASVVSIVVILPWWNTVNPSARTWALLVDLIVLVALVPGWGEQVVQSLR